MRACSTRDGVRADIVRTETGTISATACGPHVYLNVALLTPLLTTTVGLRTTWVRTISLLSLLKTLPIAYVLTASQQFLDGSRVSTDGYRNSCLWIQYILAPLDYRS